jgi:hypothetical protein
MYGDGRNIGKAAILDRIAHDLDVDVSLGFVG